MDTMERIFLGVVVGMSLLVMALQIPAIQTVRAEKFDATTASDLGELRTAISDYADENDRLPDDLTALNVGSDLDRDVATYKYNKKSSSKYELCATFRTNTIKPGSSSSSRSTSYTDFRTHPEGDHCFELTETIYTSYQNSSNSSSNSWLDSYCEQLPDDPYCS